MRSPLQMTPLTDDRSWCWSWSVYAKEMEGLRRSRKGCITDGIEKTYATWFTRPNQACTSVIPRGFWNSEVASSDIGGGDVEPGKFLSEAELARVQGDPFLGTHVQPLDGLMERCLDVGEPK